MNKLVLSIILCSPVIVFCPMGDVQYEKSTTSNNNLQEQVSEQARQEEERIKKIAQNFAKMSSYSTSWGTGMRTGAVVVTPKQLPDQKQLSDEDAIKKNFTDFQNNLEKIKKRDKKKLFEQWEKETAGVNQQRGIDRPRTTKKRSVDFSGKHEIFEYGYNPIDWQDLYDNNVLNSAKVTRIHSSVMHGLSEDQFLILLDHPDILSRLSLKQIQAIQPEVLEKVMTVDVLEKLFKEGITFIEKLSEKQIRTINPEILSNVLYYKLPHALSLDFVKKLSGYQIKSLWGDHINSYLKNWFTKFKVNFTPEALKYMEDKIQRMQEEDGYETMQARKERNDPSALGEPLYRF
ncbi:hypothetical protein HYV10_02365 [Candidatus Dependentiae bacterium]|nr:hypothetical protein [Candidatus Dependentiae bacterium]